MRRSLHYVDVVVVVVAFLLLMGDAASAFLSPATATATAKQTIFNSQSTTIRPNSAAATSMIIPQQQQPPKSSTSTTRLLCNSSMRSDNDNNDNTDNNNNNDNTDTDNNNNNAAVQNNDNLSNAKSLIAKAISIGAPAYNAGDIAECARVYRETALQVAPLIPVSLRKGLLQQSSATVGHSSDDEEAWALRQQLDAILDYHQAPYMPTTTDNATAATATAATITLEQFTTLPPAPLLVLDNVMGGVSQGRWVDNRRFIGTTSLQNNGGFASLRWRFDGDRRIQNWSYAKGIYLDIQKHPADQTFRLILKDTACDQVRGANFKTVFCHPDDDTDDTTTDDTNDTDGPILIPFTAFDQMEQMGRALAMGVSLNPAAITEIGLMAIKPTVIGEFELVVHEWGLYF